MFVTCAGKALRLTLPLMAIILGTPALAISPEMAGIIQNAASLLLIGTLACLIIEFINVMARLITQRHRIDDVVIVENEWGRIEEITLTYVVVRIWDLRRLVLPISYFIETPFQNWTRTSADILGTVFLHVDYDVPLDALRQQLTRILQASELWDGKVNVLHVTNAKDRTLEVRALASARDASAAWDLRCEVREKLIAYIQKHYPNSLPRWRVESSPQARAVA